MAPLCARTVHQRYVAAEVIFAGKGNMERQWARLRKIKLELIDSLRGENPEVCRVLQHASVSKDSIAGGTPQLTLFLTQHPSGRPLTHADLVGRPFTIGMLKSMDDEALRAEILRWAQALTD